MTRTLEVKYFKTPGELVDAIQKLLGVASSVENIPVETIYLDTDIESVRLVENTLTDGSKVYNIELA